MLFNISESMNLQTHWTQILDGVVSALTIGSFLWASIKKERINESIQFNLINVIAGFIFAIVGLVFGLYGLVVRQLFFTVIACWNLFRIFKSVSSKRMANPKN